MRKRMRGEVVGVVVTSAERFLKRWPYISKVWDLQDLIQEGYAYAPTLAALYDPSFNTKFTTYLYTKLYWHYMEITQVDRSGVEVGVDIIPDTPSDSGLPLILGELSGNARRFLDTVMSAPVALLEHLDRNKFRPFKYGVGSYLGLPASEVDRIRREMLNKVG